MIKEAQIVTLSVAIAPGKRDQHNIFCISPCSPLTCFGYSVEVPHQVFSNECLHFRAEIRNKKIRAKLFKAYDVIS